MNIIVNDERITIKDKMNIDQLLSYKGYDGKMIAVAINGDFIARDSYSLTQLNNNDKIEIVAPMQGG